MSQSCDIALSEVSNGLSASLRAVDCVAGEMTQAAFGRMFGAGGALGPVLTILLTLYIAFFAVSLLTGRSRIGISALTPRMMTLGLVLTFATSWIAYQSVVWNLAIGAPDEIATVIMGSQGSATQVFADKIDVVFGVVAQVASGGQPGAQGQSAEGISAFSPQGILWLAATLLLVGTVGILVTCRIALAVLIALGPVFVVLALFAGTRGMFVGWLKGVVMLALGPLFAVLAGSIMLELSVPVLASLSPSPGQIDPRAAMAFFMIAVVHVALMILVLRTAGTMVAGWRIFGLADNAADSPRSGNPALPAPAPRAPANIGQPVAAATTAAPAQTQRRAITGTRAMPAANDTAGAQMPGGRRETRMYTSGATPSQGAANASLSRTRGIGSRFRMANSRSMEKFK